MIEKTKDMRDNETARIEADKLNSTIAQKEIFKEWAKVKDRAPGLDNVIITYIEEVNMTTQLANCNVKLDMANKHPNEWELRVKTGLLNPLFKKWQREDINNYSGVSLLTKAI